MATWNILKQTSRLHWERHICCVSELRDSPNELYVEVKYTDLSMFRTNSYRNGLGYSRFVWPYFRQGSVSPFIVDYYSGLVEWTSEESLLPATAVPNLNDSCRTRVTCVRSIENKKVFAHLVGQASTIPVDTIESIYRSNSIAIQGLGLFSNNHIKNEGTTQHICLTGWVITCDKRQQETENKIRKIAFWSTHPFPTVRRDSCASSVWKWLGYQNTKLTNRKR